MSVTSVCSRELERCHQKMQTIGSLVAVYCGELLYSLEVELSGQCVKSGEIRKQLPHKQPVYGKTDLCFDQNFKDSLSFHD